MQNGLILTRGLGPGTFNGYMNSAGYGPTVAELIRLISIFLLLRHTLDPEDLEPLQFIELGKLRK